MKQAVLSLSGGMDSSTLLLHLLNNDYEVTALSFDYGQKHRVELERAQQLIDYLRNSSYKIKYQVIKLDGLSSLLKYSGQLLYVEHRAKVTRTSPNTYRARIVIDF